MEKQFRIDIWDFMDIESLNQVLGEYTKGTPIDIDFKCLEISERGDLLIKAEFEEGV